MNIIKTCKTSYNAVVKVNFNHNCLNVNVFPPPPFTYAQKFLKLIYILSFFDKHYSIAQKALRQLYMSFFNVTQNI